MKATCIDHCPRDIPEHVCWEMVRIFVEAIRRGVPAKSIAEEFGWTEYKG